jgi:hypothetical protein
MSENTNAAARLRKRAEREIALAEATGAKAQASPDYRTVFVQRRDGTRETVRVGDRHAH